MGVFHFLLIFAQMLFFEGILKPGSCKATLSAPETFKKTYMFPDGSKDIPLPELLHPIEKIPIFAHLEHYAHYVTQKLGLRPRASRERG